MQAVTTLEQFQELFTTDSSKLLLCHDGDACDAALATAVSGAAAPHRIATFTWACAAFPDAQRTLGIEELPTLFVIHRRGVADKLAGASAIASRAAVICGRVATAATSDPPRVAGTRGESLKIDVAKMLAMGRDLMSKGQAFYAEKFFAKAAAVLDAIEEPAARADVDVQATTAEALSWVVMARAVQGSNVDAAAAALESRFPAQCDAASSDAARALATHRLIKFAPRPWTPVTCSQKALAAALTAAGGRDLDTRAMLVVTLFLAGDVERCLTEALKLQVLGHDFGRLALNEVTTFLGPTHELVRRVGWTKQ